MSARMIASWLSIALASSAAASDAVRLEPAPARVDTFDIAEAALLVSHSTTTNPFAEVQVTATLTKPDGSTARVEGFCDTRDGSAYRVRFMPTEPGEHAYQVEYRRGGDAQTFSGRFGASDAGRRGVVRVDPEHPYHFLWSGTGEHYFWNGTTTYWMLGWQDDDTIRRAVDRLADQKVNRIRVALCGRTPGGERWDEPMVAHTDAFRFRLNPWPAARPDSVDDPGFDTARYDVEFWQKAERLLRHARERDVVVSVIFYLDGADPGVDPFGKERMGCEEERAYYRYGAARLAAFSNVMWDVTNEYHLFRDEAWTEAMANHLRGLDPYRHLMSVHGHGAFKFRTSPWVDFAMYQMWDEAGGHDFMLENRRQQQATGRPMPQVNEEYGYEDHYPTKWGGNRRPPARSADNRRRLAWGMYMAGGYQTTGERADRGTGRGADSGGGWINGRGDEQMVMLKGYAHIVECFTSLGWWRMDPADGLATDGAYCLAEPGRQYLVYLPAGGKTTVKLDGGPFRAAWFDPRTGALEDLGEAAGEWTSPEKPPGPDWALTFRLP